MLDRLLNLLFPRKCMFCRGPAGSGGICNQCRALYMDHTRPKIAALRDKKALDGVIYALAYKGGAREAVRAYKFNYRPGYAAPFGRILAAMLLHSGAEFDLVTRAPVSLRRRMERGFDHTGLLLDETAKHIGGMRFDRDVLKRGHRPAQNGLTREQRLVNLKGAVKVKKGKDVAQMSVLIIDDVVTTGSTLEECARALKAAGAARVTGLALTAAEGRLTRRPL